jgi:UDP-glucose 4-epimerase
MNILVTGGAGFIGSHLIDRLISRGDNVICIDNLSLGGRGNLKLVMGDSHFQLVEADILNMKRLEKVFEVGKFDLVYHLAANSDIQLGSNDTETDLKNTFLTTLNILNCMRTYSVPKLMFASSSAIYGDYKQEIREISGPLAPVSNYGAAKLASEAYISSYSSSYGIQAWIIRFPNVIGWRLTHGVIYDFLKKLKSNKSNLLILGNGKQEKPYLFVTDLLDAIELIIKSAKEAFNIVNVAPESLSTVDYIAEQVIKGLDLENVVIKYSGGTTGWVGDVPKFQYNTSKAKGLGWQPKYTSNEAVIRSIKKEIQWQE